MKAKNLSFWLVFLLLLVIFFLSLSLGAYRLSLPELIKTLFSPIFPSLRESTSEAAQSIIFQIRLPRILLAMIIGCALSLSGASLQALFRNPLVNEYLLGLSSGAAFGASLSIVFFGPKIPVQLSAFLFSLMAVFIVLLVSRSPGGSIVSLLLTGVIVSAFFSALLTTVEYLASPYALQALFFWLMGSFSLAGWREVIITGPIILIAAFFLLLFRWRLNLLSLSEEEGRSLGINVQREKLIVIALATLMTSAAVAAVGIIGWIGLIVPHLARMMVGADNRRVLPFSALLGSSLLLLADDLARALTSFEIPVGIFTSLIGIPLFIYLLKKSTRLWLS
ncbi:MAG: iron ABC transporter permease [Candidatus Aminicenantes bacterium]|nr:iron ABC transporter permease [Candidatus Aminicenantes bacterium]